MENTYHGWLTWEYQVTSLPAFYSKLNYPDLKPEHGWSQEITLQFSGTPGTFSTDYSLTGFNRNIQDWILWALVDGQSYWSVHNLSQVWSRGIEQRLTIQKQYKTLSTTLNAGYDLIWSTNEKKITSPDLAVGQQLVYVPRHQAFAKLAIQSKAFRASYTHSFTGEVYTLNEHTLANYQQGSVYFSYTLAPKLGEISFFLSVNNLWDSTYRVIEYRAMPGRNFLGGISFYTNSTHN